MKHSSKIFQATTTALIFMLFPITSFSQTSRFSISFNSLTTNFNYGKSNNNLQSYKKDYRGLQIGVSYQAGISPQFSLVPELYLAMKGGILKENNPFTISKSTLRLYSLEMPVLARLHYHQLYLNAGPYASYALGGRLKTAGSPASPEKSTKVSFGNGALDIKRWDFGAQAGAGYNFNMKKRILTLDVRYGYGFINISKAVARYNRMLNISLAVSKP
ncbi:MAG: porin family protein [Chitinophagaceae bacterium]